MKVVITGDRNWTDRGKIRDRLSLLPPGSTVIVGGCRGADQLAEEEAYKLGNTIILIRADWATYGRAAGPIRNGWMLDEEPDLVLAFHPNLAESKGTADCVRQARKRGIPVEHIP